jgi:hypothetical protein
MLWYETCQGAILRMKKRIRSAGPMLKKRLPRGSGTRHSRSAKIYSLRAQV